MANVKGSLKVGVEIGGTLCKDFEMREATAGDMFDAEELAPADRQVAYQGALMSRQLIRLGDVQGPIDFSVIRRLDPQDFTVLFDALQELEGLGKSASSKNTTGTDSSSCSQRAQDGAAQS